MRFVSAALVGSLSVVSTPAFATNGTQLTGYGTKAQGMGGASIALPQDAIAAANNPAGMAEVGDQIDIDAQCLRVTSDTTFMGREHEGGIFACLPEIGYNRQISPRVTLGVSMAASGAVFDYHDNLFSGQKTDKTRAFYASAAILPTATYKVTDRLTVGASLAGGFQIVSLTNFEGIPNRGRNSAFGYGWRAGALWKATDQISIGASYVSKMKFARFKGYAQDLLIGSNGHADVPEKYGFGIAVTPTPRLKIAADFQHINWQDTQFGSLFAFRNQDVYRLGASYDIDLKWTVRAGTSLARRHITSNDVVPNILFVGINSKALTGGVTRRFDDGSEISLGVESDFGSKLTGTGGSAGSSLDVDTFIISLGWGRKF